MAQGGTCSIPGILASGFGAKGWRWSMEIRDLLVQMITGASVGMVIFLIASGLTLVFGVLGVINFAHGCLYLLSAYICYTIVKSLGGHSSGGILAWKRVPARLSSRKP